jgi:hypothetical protein
MSLKYRAGADGQHGLLRSALSVAAAAWFTLPVQAAVVIPPSGVSRVPAPVTRWVGPDGGSWEVAAHWDTG